MNYLTVLGVLATLLPQQPPASDPVTGHWATDPAVVESVVYAEAAAVGEFDQGKVELTLNVRSTLMGPYDPVVCPVVRVSMQLGPRQAERSPEYPREKTRMIVRLRAYASPVPVPWYIPSLETGDVDRDGPGLVIVKDFDDPKVTEIFTRLQQHRAEKPQRPWLTVREAMLAEQANPRKPDGSISHELLEFLSKPLPKPAVNDAAPVAKDHVVPPPKNELIGEKPSP
jgi:hypothetical protein